MSLDMQQFHGVFFEESLEHLEELEQLFIEIDIDNPTSDQLDGIFRAAHSIKGGAGIFGFDALVGLTHVMESVLDKARKHEISLTQSIVDILIKATDMLREILDAYMQDSEIDWTGIEQQVKSVEGILTGNTKQSDETDYQIFDVPVEGEDEAFGFFEPFDEGADDVTSEGLERQLNEEEAAATSTKVPVTDDDPHDSKLSDDNQTSEPQVNKDVVHSAPKAGVQAAQTTIRVDTAKIDELVNLVGEMVITQSILFDISKTAVESGDDRLQSAVLDLEQNSRQIQEAVMSMRMLPMSFVFNRFPRVVKDLAKKLNKEVELKISGAETEIDKGLTEKLVDPLTHLIRNSIDHGIESPDVRKAKGKSAKGTVNLSAEHRGGSIHISITDDGAGLNAERILAKARENGLDVNDNMPKDQIWNLIFKAGFSTAQEVSDVSGRGVGMDVVKRNIESIGGTIDITSNQDKGSKFNIRLPLTLAIVDGMSVTVGGETFIIPLINIVESIRPTAEQIKTLSNSKLLWLRESYWPIVHLHEVLGIKNAKQNHLDAVLVLIETNNQKFCLLVDDLINQQQVVVKSLEQNYRKVDGVAGATILGDGRVALILDVDYFSSKVLPPKQILEALEHEH